MSIMNYAGFTTLVCLAAGLSLYLSRQCNAGDAMVNIRSKNEVEIAPDKWLPVNEGATTYASDVSGSGGNPHNMSLTEALRSLFSSGRKNAKGDTGSSSLSFKWNDKDVFWRGPEILACLREHDGTLYMIGFNREDLENTRWVCFKLNAEGTGFEEIDRTEFPKQIATQNMWLVDDGQRWIDCENYEGIVRDRFELLRKLNVDNRAFRGSRTARIWRFLEDGITSRSIQSQEFVQEYARKYSPVALPTVIPEQDYSVSFAVGSDFRVVSKELEEAGYKPITPQQPEQAEDVKKVQYALFKTKVLNTVMTLSIDDSELITRIHLYETRTPPWEIPNHEPIWFDGYLDRIDVFSRRDYRYDREVQGNFKNLSSEVIRRNRLSEPAQQ